MGQPERVAESRAKAERVRELHRLAGVELAEYLAQVEAVEEGTPSQGRDGPGWWVRPVARWPWYGCRAGGRRRSLSPQTLLPGDGYDAGVKKPVAVPKK